MNYLTESIGQSDLEIGLQLSKNLTTNRESNSTPLNANLVNGKFYFDFILPKSLYLW